MADQGSKSPLTKERIRVLTILWGGGVLIAGILTFVVLMILLSGRGEQTAEVPTASPPPTLTPVSVPQVTAIPESQDADEEGEPAPTPTAPTTTGLTPGFELGGQVPGFIQHPGLMGDVGMTWVKFQIKWNPTSDPAIAQELINAGHNNGFKVLLSISGDLYPQNTIDYEGYIDYLEQVGPMQPDAIEVWNEMNLDREWPAGEIDPTSYVENMLAPAYDVIKATSPETSVIIGALAPTGFDNGTNAWSDQRYVQGLAAADAAQYADCIGVHHNSGTTAPSARSGHVSDPGEQHYSWYFLPTVEVYYQGMNESLPVCITEFGYLTPDGFETGLPEAFSWGANNTIEEQASWLAEGVNISQELGYVELMIIWNVDFTKWDDDPQAGYAILRPDGTCPSCATLNQALQD